MYVTVQHQEFMLISDEQGNEFRPKYVGESSGLPLLLVCDYILRNIKKKKKHLKKYLQLENDLRYENVLLICNK